MRVKCNNLFNVLHVACVRSRPQDEPNATAGLLPGAGHQAAGSVVLKHKNFVNFPEII